MAKRKPIKELLRVAIWEAHSKKCAYCGEFIGWRELDIDHIIPVDTSDIEKVLKMYKRLSSFDINGPLNLLPAHRDCNTNKSNALVSEENAYGLFTKPELRYDKVLEIKKKMELQTSNDRGLAIR